MKWVESWKIWREEFWRHTLNFSISFSFFRFPALHATQWNGNGVTVLSLSGTCAGNTHKLPTHSLISKQSLLRTVPTTLFFTADSFQQFLCSGILLGLQFLSHLVLSSRRLSLYPQTTAYTIVAPCRTTSLKALFFSAWTETLPWSLFSRLSMSRTFPRTDSGTIRPVLLPLLPVSFTVCLDVHSRFIVVAYSIDVGASCCSDSIPCI